MMRPFALGRPSLLIGSAINGDLFDPHQDTYRILRVCVLFVLDGGSVTRVIVRRFWGSIECGLE